MAILRFDDVVLDADALRLTKAGHEVELEPKSFRLLTYLARNPGRVVTKEELFQHVWEGAIVSDNALTRVIAQLRKALGDDAKQARYIETVPTVGYRFIATAAETAVPSPPPTPHEPVGWLRKMLVPIGALFAIGISYLHQGGDQTVQPLPALRSVQVTSTSGLDAHPTFSPDGTSIAYASDRSGSFELFLKLAGNNGGKEVQITNDGRQNVEPAWAPDGKLIAYHSVKDRGIFVVPSLGGQPLKLTDFGSQPAWAPDSRRLVFRSAPAISFAQSELGPSSPSTLWIATTSGGAPQPLTKAGTPPGRHSSPVFSPDGKRVLFVNHGSLRSSELWEIEVRTGAVKRLEAGVRYLYSPCFTPDGSGIFFFGADAPDSIGLYAMGIDKDSRAIVRKAERLMPFEFATPRDLAIGPETRRLAYTVTTSTSNLWKWTAAGGEQPVTSEASNRLTMPVFSPDGSKLAYIMRRRGSLADIWISDADGKNANQITSAPGQDSMPSWRADGRAILYGSDRGGKPALRQYSLDTAADQPVLEFGDAKVMARLAPRSREAVFHRGSQDNLNIWKVDLNTRKEVQLTNDTESAAYPVWSTDGSRIAVELGRGADTHIALVSSAGGVPAQITSRPGQAWPWSWSPDGKKIAFSAHWDGVWNVHTMDADGQNIQQLTRNNLVRVFLRYPAWPPKGQPIVFERNETKGNIFIAEPAASGVNNR